MLLNFILISLEAFLLGSIPFGYLTYKAKTGGDIRAKGSGNIGATNVLRTAGAAAGLLTLFLDAGKGYLAIVIADLLSYRSVPQPYVFMQTGTGVPAYHFGWVAWALLLAIVGHMFTPWLHFEGGKGVATGLGIYLALAPLATLYTLVVFAVVLAISRYVSLASIVAALTFLPILWWRVGSGYPWPIYVASLCAALLIVWRHKANIDRLLRGTENRLGRKQTA